MLRQNSYLPPYLILSLLLFLLLQNACEPLTEKPIDQEGKNEIVDPLPSWEEEKTRQEIIDFVNAVCDEKSPDYVAPNDRIACFDNDGTLWSEKPMYFQLFFAIDRVKELAPEHPEWANEQPFKSILENDLQKLLSFGEHGLLEIVMATHSGMSTEEFELIVEEWLNMAKHPRFQRPFTELVYQPMLELLDYLRENEFKTFIVSGGGIEFMRPWVDDVYGIEKDQVVGSSIKTELIYQDGIPQIMRLGEIDFIDDKEGKPLGINKFIGKRPILAVGNSDGDLAMLEWTAAGEGKRFMMYIHHTDSIREWAYDRNSSVGRLDKGLDKAQQKKWSVANMEKDWKVIYPFELSNN